MQYRIRCLGHSHFLLLPDLPSISSSPSLSFRPSRGLLSRYAASNSSAQILSSSMLFFCSSSSGANAADAITLSESLVADVDRFVGVMDGLSRGRFLCDDVELLGSTVQWMELPWLKDMGYYSLEAFVANRLELALRLAWISSQVGKKPKEKKVREKAAKVAGNAANAFWRMKSCGDWWIGLDPGKRKVIVSAFFGKAANTLVNEIIMEEKAALRNGFGFLNTETNMPLQYSALSSWQKAKQAPFRRELYCCLDFLPVASSRLPNSLTMALKKLIVICDLANMLLAWQLSKDENENFFFSSLGSTLTISDHILRRLQKLLMVVHTDFINHELMDDSKLSIYSGKAEEKCNLACQRRKSKSCTSKNTAIPKAYKICSRSQEPSKENTRVSVDNKSSNGKKKSRRKDSKSRSSDLKKIGMPKPEGKMDTILSVAAGREPTETVGFICTQHSHPMSVGMSDTGIEEDHSLCFIKDRISESEECHPSYGERENDIPKHISPCLRKFEESQETINQSNTYLKGQIDPTVETIGRISVCACELDNVDRKNKHLVSRIACSTVLKSFVPLECFLAANDELNSVVFNGGIESYAYKASNSLGGTSYEWPSITPFQLASINSHLPAATDRLNLDADNGCPYQLHHSFLPPNTQVGSSSGEFLHSQILPSLAYPMSYDWPPMVQNCSRLSQTLTVRNEGLYSQSLPLSSSYSGLDLCAAHREQVNVASGKNEVKHAGDIIDAYDTKNISDLVEDTESYWLSEEESEIHAISGRDYNKFFGGGVMYWNPAEFVGTGFSRPPSHSSEDSSWAWHDADLNRTIDDMVGGKSGLPAAYNTNGITSPSSSYCLSFDPLPSGHQSMGYAIVGNDGSSNVVHSSTLSDPSDEKISSSTANSTVGVEGGKGDPPHPMLSPIIIPGMSRKIFKSDFKVCCGHKSPCLPSTRRDTPRIKRPPSPMVLCVPSVPRPPPPSPIGESKRRGFPIVRSGSSSPRHWGVKSWFHEESNVSDPRLCLDGAEVVWPTWARKGHGVTAVAQSLPGSLLQDHLITISKIAHDQEHPDIALPLQPPDLLNGQCKGSLSMMHNFLHEEIDFFCKQVAAENLIRKPYINWAVRRVTRALQVLWPRSRTNVFGSNVTGLALPTSDVDLVVSLPPVRNLEPIKEAGILEGRNGIKETCLQHAARYLANQDWVRNDSLKTVENTAIPVIMLVAEVPCDMTSSNGIASIVDVSGDKSAKMYGEHSSSSHLNLSSSQNMLSSKSLMTKDDAVGVKSICLDISFKSTSHTGLQTSELVKELSQQFPASVPLALVLKKFLADRSLDHSYSGGLSSYCLVLLITRFLQHEHHSGHSTKQNLGGLFMDFLYFFGNVFDPRQMRISIQGSGVYIKRERCLSIDPIHIDDPLFPTNNVGRNCFRIHQCIKAFADAYATLENELTRISDEKFQSSAPSFRLLQKIIPSIDCGE